MNETKTSNTIEKENLKHQYHLNYAPHLGMFENLAGSSFTGQIQCIKELGFNYMEENFYFDRPESEQEEISEAIKKNGIETSTFLGMSKNLTGPTITTGDSKMLDEFLKQVEHSVDLAKKLNARRMTIVSGYTDTNIYYSQQWVNVAEAFKKAAEILEPHGLVMVLEGTNFMDRPGMFINSIPRSYAICKAVNSPSLKVLFDIYHAQRQDGNLIPMIDEFWDEVEYIQAADNPGRLEPTTGEINYKNIFKHIYNKGYKGVIGMEHGNSTPGLEGEIAVIRAYQECDKF